MAKKLSGLKRLKAITHREPWNRKRKFDAEQHFRVEWYGCIPLVPLSVIEDGATIQNAVKLLLDNIEAYEGKRFVIWMKTDNNGDGKYLFANPRNPEQVEALKNAIRHQVSLNLSRYHLSVRSSTKRIFVVTSFAADLIDQAEATYKKAA